MNAEIIVEWDKSVLTLTFSNPRKRNALTPTMYDQLEAQLLHAAQTPDLRAVVLRGTDDAFAGGTDIKHLATLESGQDGVEYEAWMARVQHALLSLRVPVIAVVKGPCAGGGLVLTALSDLAYCTPDARFGSPIARTIGNTLSAASLARLRLCLGPRLAMEMLLTARLISAEEALSAGLVNAVVDRESIEEVVTEALGRIAQCSPASLRSFKELERRLDQAVPAVEADDVYREVYGGHDFKEGVAAFLEKRTPQFGGTP